MLSMLSMNHVSQLFFMYRENVTVTAFVSFTKHTQVDLFSRTPKMCFKFFFEAHSVDFFLNI